MIYLNNHYSKYYSVHKSEEYINIYIIDNKYIIEIICSEFRTYNA